MQTKPWISGPIELLWHGYDHMEKNSDFDQRLAMISFDPQILPEAILKQLNFYHTIRNYMYHRGNRLTIEAVKWANFARLSSPFVGQLLQIPF